MEAVLKTYDARLDSKKRITIRNPKYEYYHVVEQENVQNGKVYGPIEIKK